MLLFIVFWSNKCSLAQPSFKNIKTTFEWLCTWHNIWRIKYMANYCCCPSTKIE